jgi:ubiquinone/menaquinone biosynthesis C-methylase UbiE
MQRIPEPVLMVGKDQCYEFAKAHALREHVRYAFVEWLFAKIPMHGNIADLGCGSGELLIDICRADNDANKFNIVGFDGSSVMLEHANLAISHHNLQSRITTKNLLFENITQNDFDVAISCITLHHQHNPLEFWDIIKRITKRPGYVLVMDLIRPNTENDVDQLIKTNASDWSQLYQQDYKNSLLAAFSLAEIQQQLDASGLGHLSIQVDPNEEMAFIYGKI